MEEYKYVIEEDREQEKLDKLVIETAGLRTEGQTYQLIPPIKKHSSRVFTVGKLVIKSKIFDLKPGYPLLIFISLHLVVQSCMYICMCMSVRVADVVRVKGASGSLQAGVYMVASLQVTKYTNNTQRYFIG